MFETTARLVGIKIKAPENPISKIPATLVIEVEESPPDLAPLLAFLGSPVYITLIPSQTSLDWLPPTPPIAEAAK